MLQNANAKKVGKLLLNWAAVLVLILAVIIFTAIKGTRFFSVNSLVAILRGMI